MTMFSLIIPVFNEEPVLCELVGRTVKAIESFTGNYEIIFVDDGSTDGSLARLLSFRDLNRRIKILVLSRNFGHQAAYTAGLEHAKGDIVAMMDGDLQDPPELLKEMFMKIQNEGFDVVSARKTGRKGSKSRNLLFILFHLFFRNIAELKNIENAGNFSMMTRRAADALLSMKEKIRYLPGLRSFVGFKQGFVDYVRDERFYGKPKMNTGKLFRLAGDAIFSFSKFPIRLCFLLGIAGVTVFLAAGLYVLIAKILHFAIPGWSSILLSIYFLGSIQLVFLGILGEYIFRNYRESQNRPIYFVKSFYNSEGNTTENGPEKK